MGWDEEQAQERQRAREEKRRLEALLGQTEEELQGRLVRGTPFRCHLILNQPTDSDPVKLFFRLSDPGCTLADERYGLDVFKANLFWFPERQMLGIERVAALNGLGHAGVGRIGTRNIFDAARSLGATRIELLAGDSEGPYFWAKCGARLQEETAVVGLWDQTLYTGAAEMPEFIRDNMKRLVEKNLIGPERYDHFVSLASSGRPEKVLWELSDDKTPVPSGKEGQYTSLGRYCLSAWGIFNRYAARFDLAADADDEHRQRMNAYLSPSLALDRQRYEATLRAMLARDEKIGAAYRIRNGDNGPAKSGSVFIPGADLAP